jgi:putative tricarboxylic transport membrane protein
VRRARLVVCAGALLLGVIYLAATWRYPAGTLKQPGPGLYPLMVAGLLLISACATAWITRAADRVAIAWPQRAGWLRMGAILLAIIVYIALLPKLGHLIAAAVTAFISLQAMGGLRWPVKIFLAVFLGAASYFVFNDLLGVPLPGRVWFR